MTRPSNTQMHEQPNSSDHDRHDLLAVAALADRDATGEEAVRAQAQVDTCTECASLHAELVSLASATRTLPAMQRPRDFQLTAGGRPATAPEPDPSSVRVIRDGPRRFQPAARRWVSRRSALPACCSGSCPARCHSVALRAPQADRRRASAPQQEIQQTLGRGRCRFSSAGSDRQQRRRPRAARRERTRRAGRAAAAGREPAAGSGPGLRQRRRGGRHPGTNGCGHVQPARRRRREVRASPRSPRIVDRRLGADRRLGDAAHHRARAVCPALDLAPLRRLTTGRPARAVPDGSRRDPPVHLGTCPPNA